MDAPWGQAAVAAGMPALHGGLNTGRMPCGMDEWLWGAGRTSRGGAKGPRLGGYGRALFGVQPEPRYDLQDAMSWDGLVLA